MFISQSIMVYGSMDPATQCLVTLRNPEGCPVLCLKHSRNFLFAGLRDGTLMVYERHHGGTSYITLDVSLYCMLMLPLSTPAKLILLSSFPAVMKVVFRFHSPSNVQVQRVLIFYVNKTCDISAFN